MRVAVTGASGFVGRHVIEALAARKDVGEVVVASRLATESRTWPSGVRAVRIDVCEPAGESFDALGRPDVLIHLAWGGLPNYKSLHHCEVQLGAHYRFLSGLVKGGLPSLLCAGTCLEYGLRAGELHEDLPANPTTAYGFAKDGLRRQLELLRDVSSFALTWARLFYMYGDGQPASSLYPALMAAIDRGDRVFPMSRGDQLRDYLAVEEAARLLVALALDAAGAGVVNVCSGNPVSVRSLVERWISERRSDIELDLGRYPVPDYEPLAFWGATAKLHKMLPGQSPERLDDGARPGSKMASKSR